MIFGRRAFRDAVIYHFPRLEIINFYRPLIQPAPAPHRGFLAQLFISLSPRRGNAKLHYFQGFGSICRVAGCVSLGIHPETNPNCHSKDFRGAGVVVVASHPPAVNGGKQKIPSP